MGAVSGFWLRIVVGAALFYAVIALSAEELGSLRGEAGLAVAALTLAIVLAYDRFTFTRSFAQSWRELGLGAPAARGMAAGGLICVVLAAALLCAASLTGAGLTLRGDWAWLTLGILAQAGVSEELTFRGFVYGRIRATRPFWRAAALSIAPFALVHLAMFAIMPWPIAAASLALAIVLCFPLAQLYELGGRTIWAPVMVHAVIQGALKIVDIEKLGALPLIWIGVCALAPFLAFLWRRPA